MIVLDIIDSIIISIIINDNSILINREIWALPPVIILLLSVAVSSQMCPSLILSLLILREHQHIKENVSLVALSYSSRKRPQALAGCVSGPISAHFSL